MHHVFDEVPRDNYTPPKIIPSTSVTDAIFGHHVGKIGEPDVPVYDQVDVSQFRARGYKIGSLKTGPEDPDAYYKQPGHALSPQADKGGRFNVSFSSIMFMGILLNFLILLSWIVDDVLCRV